LGMCRKGCKLSTYIRNVDEHKMENCILLYHNISSHVGIDTSITSFVVTSVYWRYEAISATDTHLNGVTIIVTTNFEN
jgi:hypothetical protein